MNTTRYVAVCFAAIFLIISLTGCQPKKVYEFSGVEGPVSADVIQEIKPDSYQIYSEGSSSRLAILLTDENSNWLSLAHGLKSSGIPFLITKDVEQAIQHKMVLVYPAISGRLLSEKSLKALAQYPEDGGILLASNVLGGGMNSVFGFDRIVESKTHSHVSLDHNHDTLASLADLTDGPITIGSLENSAENIGLNSYSNPVNDPIATYEDGTAAITQMSYDDGAAYALGIDLGQLLARGYSNRQQNISEHYVNEFQPTSDVFLEFVKTLYLGSSSTSLALGRVPQGKSLSVIITHDIDYTKSYKNAVAYAEYENEEGIAATYFIQTKYMKDFNDGIFFNDENLAYLRALQDLGMEIASHGVSHSLGFNSFPIGRGDERYPDYVPFVESEQKTHDGTIFGELRVSKFLLDYHNQQNGEFVSSFRPGFLRNPPQLPDALEASGYTYSSSTTANNTLTHLPFRLNRGRRYNTSTDVFEFPITIEDDQLPPLETRFEEAMSVARSIEQYGGLYVVLIHTDVIGQKLEFEKKLVKALKPTAWFGSLSTFGDWWSARDKVSVDVEERESSLYVTMHAPDLIEGLTIEVPDAYSVSPETVGRDNIKHSGNLLILKQAEGRIEIILDQR